MNLDDFEQRLRREPVKPIPSEWREQILTQARATQPETRNSELGTASLLSVLWQRLVWPNPKAWAGLAAIWLVILGLNLASRDSAPRTEARMEPAPNSELRRLLKEQEQLYAELIERPLRPVAAPLANRPKRIPPGPHSWGRDEFFNA